MKSNLEDDIIPITDLMRESKELISRLKRTKKPVLVTQHGRAAMVCMDVGNYQEQLKKLEMIDLILSGETAFSQGEFKTWESFKSELSKL